MRHAMDPIPVLSRKNGRFPRLRQIVGSL